MSFILWSVDTFEISLFFFFLLIIIKFGLLAEIR